MPFPRDCFFNDMTGKKPRILISACLAGDNVRYDAQEKSAPALLAFFTQHAELVKVCPEVGAGFGVPRPPVELTQTPSGIRAIGVADPGLDATDKLDHFARSFLEQAPLHAAILKSRSPSCGFGTTPVFSKKEITGLGNGIFANHLHELWPRCIIVDENMLSSEDDCRDLLFQCLRRIDREITPPHMKHLLESHYRQMDGDFR